MLTKLRTAHAALELCDWRVKSFTSLRRCNKRIANGISLMEQAFLYSKALSAKVPGSLVECGSFKGSTTAVLSLAAKQTGRKLHVFDSFCGLPEPSETDARHNSVGETAVHTYRKGEWAGSLDEVKNNVSRFGRLSVCELHPGFFADTLPHFKEAVAMVFCDVDLRESLETCVQYLWPLLSSGGLLFTHEATDYIIAELFYNTSWWQRTLGISSPGLVGAGSGIGLIKNGKGFHSSYLGFTVKASSAPRVAPE